jgi:diguanylate cyclase (GGDEF)-like protein
VIQLAAAVLIGAVLGYLVAILVAGPGRQESQVLRERERAEADRTVARQGRQLQDLEARLKEQVEVFQILPDLVRQMFTATGKRGMMPVLLKLVEHLFHPLQTAIFLVRPVEQKQKLLLADGRGLPASLAKGTTLDYGQGRPGYVAQHRLAMDEGDFATLGATARRQLESTAVRELEAEVVVPMEYGDSLVGVLTVGGAQRRVGHEKRLLKMVGDLAAVAIHHVASLSATKKTADVDGLTGTYTKRALTTRLGDEIHKAERDGVPLGLLILDIDHFKNYNDTNGHQDGDEVLKKVGQLLMSHVREEQDVVARYGGEEFVVLFPGATKSLALRVADGLRAAVESHPFPHAALQPLGKLSISGGVAAFPDDARSMVELIRAADQALYEAKAQGRNRILPASRNDLT